MPNRSAFRSGIAAIVNVARGIAHVHINCHCSAESLKRRFMSLAPDTVATIPRMDEFSYLSVLISVILGLAVTQILKGSAEFCSRGRGFAFTGP
jgi:hypothetical protein